MAWYDVVFQPVSMEMQATKQELINNLEQASGYLEYMEYIVDERHKVADYRGKIDKTIQILSLPDTAYKNVSSALKIARAISDLKKIRYIHNNPEAAAYPFGRLFAGIGELASYLPPPVNGYFEIFAEAELFFVNMRAKMQPEVHFREPGLRETIDNL